MLRPCFRPMFIASRNVARHALCVIHQRQLSVSSGEVTSENTDTDFPIRSTKNNPMPPQKTVMAAMAAKARISLGRSIKGLFL